MTPEARSPTESLLLCLEDPEDRIQLLLDIFQPLLDVVQRCGVSGDCRLAIYLRLVVFSKETSESSGWRSN